MKKRSAPFGAFLLALPFLYGCTGIPQIDLPIAAAVAVTSPVWVPIEYGVSQSNVKQPVEVVTKSGNILTPNSEKKPEASLVIQNDAVICEGEFDLSRAKFFRSKDPFIELKCNKGLRGKLNFAGLTTRKAIVTVGPRSAPLTSGGSLTETSLRCGGNFNKKKEVVDAFLLECDDGRFGALSPMSAEKGVSEFTVWLPPPL